MDKDLLKKLVIDYKQQEIFERQEREQRQEEIDKLIMRQNDSHNKNIYMLLYKSEYGDYRKFVESLAAELRKISDEQN